MSVYSLKFTRISFLPVYFAKFSTRDVLPTPGGPSIKRGLPSVNARSNFIKLLLVDSASNAYSETVFCMVRPMTKGETPILSLVLMKEFEPFNEFFLKTLESK